MVGVCGRLGRPLPVDPLTEWIRYRDDEIAGRHADDRFSLVTSFHGLLAGDQPATAAGGDVRVWVWGDVYGHGAGDAYEPRPGPAGGSAAYCARLYDEYGPGFVGGLNGDFALVVHDRAARTVSFVTDRLATRPIFRARPDDESLLFASSAQALACHPAVETRFDPAYLQEYLALRTVPGVKTPLVGVEELLPGAVTTVDLADLSTTVERYWRPSYDPVDRPFSYFLDRFTDTVERVLSEWTREDLAYGLLLSGGGDSRLVQAAMDRRVTAFHAAGWMSREARVARRAALARGDEFRLLVRDEDYLREAFERNPRFSNFSGWFDQAYFLGFDADIVGEVDVLLSGLYADMLFAGGPLATRGLSLGRVGNVSLPVAKSVDTVADYVEVVSAEAAEPVPYLATSRPVADVLADNVRRDGDGVVSHGVRYGSLRDLLMYGEHCPLGADTDAIFSRSLMHLRPYRTPFLDNRLLDLQQEIPVDYLLRRNLVGRAVARLEPALAEIPHAGTGVPLKYPFSVTYLGEQLNGFRRKHLFEESPPAAHLDHGPWPNREELLRVNDFPERVFREHEGLLSDHPHLEYEGAMECYRDHLDGADNTTLLYSLLTLLGMPATEHVHRRASQGEPA